MLVSKGVTPGPISLNLAARAVLRAVEVKAVGGEGGGDGGAPAHKAQGPCHLPCVSDIANGMCTAVCMVGLQQPAHGCTCVSLLPKVEVKGVIEEGGWRRLRF